MKKAILFLLFCAMAGVAAAQATQGQQPLDLTITNDCTGEQVQITGTTHWVLSYYLEGTVQRASLQYHYSGLSAVGLTSGNSYVVSILHKLVTNGQLVSGQWMWRHESTIRLRTAGAGNNFTSRFVDHLVFNNNDVMLVDKLLLDSECR